jgi:hypothetical protein
MKEKDRAMNKVCFLVALLFAAATILAQQHTTPKHHPSVQKYQDIDWQHFNSKTASPALKRKVNEYMEIINGLQPNHLAGSPGEVKSLIINGNKITTSVYNYGSITRPNTGGNVFDLVWNRLGYGYEFAPLVAAEVVNAPGETLRIVDDGLWLQGQGDYSPSGLKWGWLPQPGYSAPGQSKIAAWSQRQEVGGDLTRKPAPWPESFYNSAAGRYVWPAFLGNDATSPDEEVYFVMDDYTNAEFPYYPFPNDTTKRGLGLEMECRFFQFNNPLAEDIIFLVYRVTNRSPRTLRKVWFGMYGDPHVGGPNSFNDDLNGFYGPKDSSVSQRARNIIYSWDVDGRGDNGLPSGYFGFKFLESPTNSNNVKDDDDDGIVDESPFNDAGLFIDGVSRPLNFGIADTNKYKRLYGSPKPRWSGDENGNWNLERDDVGLDGLPGTGDFGEGNGRPDIGTDANNNITAEPNFGIRDVNESDQIGLTSFRAFAWGNPNFPSNDPLFFQWISEDTIDINQTLFTTPGDNGFLYGSGPFTLEPGGTQRFSVALMMGTNLQDLILNSETSQRILEANYQFAQPPPKPNLVAVPGDRRVTLYWDNIAENTADALTNARDFEGYKIYRSEDPTFADVFTITDANGVPYLGKPLEQNGVRAQFDLVNTWQGLHPVEYIGRGIKYDLGSNTGLRHEYIDSSVTNGKTYYYAVASYDHGFDSLGVQLPPTESQIAILQDVITGEYTFDVNTAAIVPGPLPTGTKRAGITENAVKRVRGISTGSMRVSLLNDRVVPDNVTYSIDFDSLGNKVVYNVKPEQTFSEKIFSRDTVFVPLLRKNLIASSISVVNSAGAVVPPANYRVDTEAGRIRGTTSGALARGEEFEIRYQYYTIQSSSRLNNEDDNPTFDGMKLFVKADPAGLDSARSKWIVKNNTNLNARIARSTAFPNLEFRPAPLDFQVVWNNTAQDSAGRWLFPGDTLLDISQVQRVITPFRIRNITDTTTFRVIVTGTASDKNWRPGRELVILVPPRFNPPNNRTVLMTIRFDSVAAPVRLPAEGNIYEAKTTKEFQKGDRFQFTTTALKFEPVNKDSLLNRIYVVPNPYVAFSPTENPGSSSNLRGENQLQFRNLPPKCTIRIYTMVGELVTTIHKDDNTSSARWNVLSNEGQRLAYGVYLYHVDAPGIGEKIGRLALIK